MNSEWVRFFELVERLQTISPGLGELAIQFSTTRDPKILEEVERQLSTPANGNGRQEGLFKSGPNAGVVNLRRWEELQLYLCTQEETLRNQPATMAENLVRVQVARRAFEETLQEMLRVEQRAFAVEMPPAFYATEEEMLASLQEFKETGGKELHEFLGELDQVLHDRERIGT